jgi:hypothetical protein
MTQKPFWFLLNLYGWAVLAMSIITAIVIKQTWVVLLGVIGYLLALLVDLIGGRSLGRTGAVRLARAEQENRELRAEQARLIGAIRERDARLAAVGQPPSEPVTPPPTVSEVIGPIPTPPVASEPLTGSEAPKP